MRLIKWHDHPWRTLDDLQDEINRLFSLTPGTVEGNTSVPLVDISEDKDAIYVEADLPGFEHLRSLHKLRGLDSAEPPDRLG